MTRLLKQIGIAVVAIVASSMLGAGCSRSGCSSGADSAEDAVRKLLAASVDGEPDDVICRYIADGEDLEDAKTWFGDLHPQIAELGGAADVELQELPAERMGAEHRYALGPPTDPIAVLAVMEVDQRFTISVNGSNLSE